MGKRIILASQSPRRQQLLKDAGVYFEVITQHTHEIYPEDLPVKEVPEFIARTKALAVEAYLQNADDHFENAIIIAADTIVLLNNRVIGKPADRNEALEILEALNESTHEVITGIVVKYQKQEFAFCDVTEVTFKRLSKAQIEHYIDKYKPYDKAGAYAIQEWIGLIGITKINGDFYNVMGLPVNRVIELLQELGAL